MLAIEIYAKMAALIFQKYNELQSLSYNLK